jgi:MFS family permease
LEEAMNTAIRHVSFRRFLIARVCSIAGQQMLLLAISWQMYDLTGSAWYLGLVGLFQFVPSLMTTFVAGHCADRVHRGRLVSLCLAAQAAVAASLAVATGQHVVNCDVLLGLSLLLGAIRPFQMSGLQALLPMLVPPAVLTQAMALSTAGQQVSVIAGPALGGMLFALGVSRLYETCGVLFALSAGMCLLIRYEYVAPPAREPVTLATMLAGIRFVWSNPLVLGGICWICSPCCSVAPRRSFRFTQKRSFMSGPKASACCARRLPPARYASD